MIKFKLDLDAPLVVVFDGRSENLVDDLPQIGGLNFYALRPGKRAIVIE